MSAAPYPTTILTSSRPRSRNTGVSRLNTDAIIGPFLFVSYNRRYILRSNTNVYIRATYGFSFGQRDTFFEIKYPSYFFVTTELRPDHVIISRNTTVNSGRFVYRLYSKLTSVDGRLLLISYRTYCYRAAGDETTFTRFKWAAVAPKRYSKRPNVTVIINRNRLTTIGKLPTKIRTTRVAIAERTKKKCSDPNKHEYS